ncbi:Similar to Probable pectate lyase E; acc. no. Q4WC29 [Pyronema omphalodes CBS 100304]|uniref:Pectate lyase n=1 Tax=Pyronema omphalodes (strain CBS 100304) TaxID=1076935 RepID=U4LBE6_PYROM|nr:Similar to Probable pectate lyase E; acc. no. Q4WC29 [Pyronema omphalodes CBS 100304]
MQFLTILPFITIALGAATTTFPSATGTLTYSAVQTISAGGTYDGKMKRIDRGVSCTGQAEGGDKDAVFILQEGATLKNVIIGPNQIEGVHCKGSCTIQNVWWDDVCEDALTIKQTSGTSIINGGGARNADDKIIQHNGAGKVVIKDFYAENFGKLYRSCGNCSTQYKRAVEISGVVAKTGKVLAGANENFGDTVTIKSACLKDVKKVCVRFDGNDNGDEPSEISNGPDGKVCIYDTSVITSNC